MSTALWGLGLLGLGPVGLRIKGLVGVTVQGLFWGVSGAHEGACRIYCLSLFGVYGAH